MKLTICLGAEELDLMVMCLKHYAKIINHTDKPELGNPYAELASKLRKYLKAYDKVSKRK